MRLVSSEGVWTCVFGRSRGIRSVVVWWIRSDPVFVHLCSCVFRLDPSDLTFSSSATVVVLVRWSYEALAQRLPDPLLQQVMSDSGEGGAMMAARLRFTSVFVVVARWSTCMVVIFIAYVVLSAAMIENE